MGVCFQAKLLGLILVFGLSQASSAAAASCVLEYFRKHGSLSPLEFSISSAQRSIALKRVDRNFLNQTLFVIPNNDGEARRAAEMLEAVNAPQVHISQQGWGVDLSKEVIPREKYKGVRRIVLFEMPGAAQEERFRKAGYEVIIIDHHKHGSLDRLHPKSSLEQLSERLNWPMGRADYAIAINDRSYIPGLKKMGLTNDEIRRVRKYDYLAQGKSEADIERATQEAQASISRLEQKNGVFLLDVNQGNQTFIRQELALQAPSGVVNALEVVRTRIGFSGSPELVKKLYAIDFEKFGYAPGSFEVYSGGQGASGFFGFKILEGRKIKPEVIQEVQRVLGF